jgi:stage III sporulation protein AG
MKEEIKALLEKKKWTGKDLMIGIVVIGVLIAVLFVPTGEKRGNAFAEIQTSVSEMTTTETSLEYEEELEMRLEAILSQMEGVGAVDVMITLKPSSKTQDKSFTYTAQNTYPEVEGVFVVSQGGDDSSVKLAITEAIQALFGIDVHKIKIVKMNT